MNVRWLFFGIVLAIAVLLAAAGAFIWSGVYDVGADAPHTRPVLSVLQTMRVQAIAARADALAVPDLSDPARITQGAGNYHAMCMGCHLAPGMAETELSKGLYPAPPDLSRATVDAARAFWVIKHGIKASGMPAWGKSMEDEYIWNMTAFLQQLPRLDAGGYAAMVASSSGHDHGGGEAIEQAHADAASAGGDAMEHDRAPSQAQPASVEHRHADGTVESHPAPTPRPAEDGHDHEH